MTIPQKKRPTKRQRRLSGRIKDFERMKSDHEGEYHKPGSFKK